MWLIEDHLEGMGEHEVELFLHLAGPAMEHDGLCVRLKAPRGDLWIVPLEHAASFALSVEEGWISRGYGYREPAPVLRYAARARTPASFTTGLALVRSGGTLEDARALLAAARGLAGGER